MRSKPLPWAEGSKMSVPCWSENFSMPPSADCRSLASARKPTLVVLEAVGGPGAGEAVGLVLDEDRLVLVDDADLVLDGVAPLVGQHHGDRVLTEGLVELGEERLVVVGHVLAERAVEGVADDVVVGADAAVGRARRRRVVARAGVDVLVGIGRVLDVVRRGRASAQNSWMSAMEVSTTSS